MRVLVTGAAGFIGYHVSQALISRGDSVIGIDNLNDYYDPALKESRLIRLNHPNFEFTKSDLADNKTLEQLFKSKNPQSVVHLGAQAGVRYSIENPRAYIESNIAGHFNILECCRHHRVDHLVYASSSSVYGANKKVPFSETDSVDHPVSLYAATKKSNELMSHTYSHLYDIPTTGLRFFTVYGPWGRPDMAYFSFTQKIMRGETIPVFNHGKMERDFTYIDDIVEGVLRVLDQPPSVTAKRPGHQEIGNSHERPVEAPYSVYNIGNNNPITLDRFIKAIENSVGKEAIKDLLPMQPGDVTRTYADIESLEKSIGYKPATSIEVGIQRFVEWYKQFYNH